MDEFSGAFKPPAERGEKPHPFDEKRDADEQHEDIADENDHAGKQIALLGDVGLIVFQNVPCQSDMKGVGSPKE
jgi:hypothetical protein